MNQSDTSFVGIDETIGQMDRLYRTLTGAMPPQSEASYAPIPAEKDPVQHVEEQMSRLLSMLGQAQPAPAAAVPWMPPMSVWESDTELVVCLDLAGLRREQVEVAVQGDSIAVQGVRPSNPGLRLRSSEYAFGPFRRTLLIPAALRAGEPTAQMKDGVLEIRIRKAAGQAESPRPVPVH